MNRTILTTISFMVLVACQSTQSVSTLGTYSGNTGPGQWVMLQNPRNDHNLTINKSANGEVVWRFELREGDQLLNPGAGGARERSEASVHIGGLRYSGSGYFRTGIHLSSADWQAAHKRTYAEPNTLSLFQWKGGNGCAQLGTMALNFSPIYSGGKLNRDSTFATLVIHHQPQNNCAMPTTVAVFPLDIMYDTWNEIVVCAEFGPHGFVRAIVNGEAQEYTGPVGLRRNGTNGERPKFGLYNWMGSRVPIEEGVRYVVSYRDPEWRAVWDAEACGIR